MVYGTYNELVFMGFINHHSHHWGAHIVPSGKHTKSYGKWPIEIDGLPINSMVMFNSYVKLPEGTFVVDITKMVI